jgi:hypothetical protein
MLIHKTSLSQTVDAINAAFFEGRAIPLAERKAAARWIAARQGLPRSYADTFAGFDRERASGIVSFTGERFTSASARHILGEEACRALRLLRVPDKSVQAALDRANDALLRCLALGSNPGKFCCGKCSVGMWRNLLSGGLDRREERLRRGALYLRTMRKGQSAWSKFPFWYTVLALVDMDVPEATRELRYAAPVLERAAKRSPGASKYAQRRHEIADRAMARL